MEADGTEGSGGGMRRRWRAPARGWMGRPRGRRAGGRPLRSLALAFLTAAVGAGPAASQERSTFESFGIETAGASAGWLVGFGMGRLLVGDDCGEDMGCMFSDLALVLATASGGSALGAWGLGRSLDGDPSLAGAAIGSVGGAAAGLAILKMLEEIDPSLDDGLQAVIAFTLVQGMVTAVGSRIGAGLR